MMSAADAAMPTAAAAINIGVKQTEAPIGEPFTLTASFTLPAALPAATWQVRLAQLAPETAMRIRQTTCYCVFCMSGKIRASSAYRH